MIKILFLVPYPTIQGPLPKILPILLEQLENLGCDIQQGFWSRHSDDESVMEKITGRFHDIQQIRNQLKDTPIDVMVITTTHDWMAILRDLPLLVVVRSLCPKIVIQFHGSYSNRLVSPGNALMKFFTKLIIKRVDAVLLFSSEEIHEWEEFCPSMKYYRVDNPYVHQGKSSDQKSCYKEIALNDYPVLLYVGRLIEEKGIFDLLNAFVLVNKKIRIRLVIAGMGSKLNNLKEKIQQAALQDQVILKGYLNGKDLDCAYRSSDIFILPSWREGFPLALVEAMDYGLPIITTRIRGAVDRLVEGVNVLFVNPRQPEELACAIEKLLIEKTLCQKMSKNNLEKVKKFAPEIVSRRYYGIIKEVIDGRNEYQRI